MRTPASMWRRQDALAQRGLALGQLGQRVDALGRLERRLVDRDGRAAVGRQQPDHVGQVELALRVLGRQPGQRGRESGVPEAVEPDVELVERELLGARVPRLDDAGDAVARRARCGRRRAAARGARSRARRRPRRLQAAIALRMVSGSISGVSPESTTIALRRRPAPPRGRP